LTRTLIYIRRVRRNWVYRAFAGIISAWLVICLVEPAQLHTCAMHGGLAIGGAHAIAHGTGGHAGSAAHHAAPSPAAASTQSHHDRDSDSQSHQCSCLGDCSVGKTPLSLPGATAALQAAPIGRVAVTPAGEVPAITAPQFLLPFANGPPAISSRA